MASLESLKDYLQGLSHKEVLRIISLYAIIFMALVGFFLFRHFNTIAELDEKTRLLNKARGQIQQVLTSYEHIKNKKKEVDKLLAEDKNFYLQKYYQDTIAGLNISNPVASTLQSSAGPAGYTEDSLQITLSQISMKQLCDFLQALQSKQRVFVRNVDITKANVDKKINVNMSIATLKPIAEKNK